MSDELSSINKTVSLYLDLDHEISLPKRRASVPFVLRVCHHEVVRDNQDKDEDAQEIGKETQVLVVKHLQ
jgi:hypothetical protein